MNTAHGKGRKQNDGPGKVYQQGEGEKGLRGFAHPLGEQSGFNRLILPELLN